ncbi:Kinesin-like protein 1, partial [Sarcoptes scabiei]
IVVNIDPKCGQCSLINPDDRSVEPKTFTFDGAYNSESTTEQIYNEIVFPIVESVTEGYNGTVFAYGQTGCGKSFTMQGTSDPINRGIIPRAFEHIFEAISTTENSKFLVQASYLEIYNEEIRDLLGNDIKKKLELKEHPETGVYVGNLSMHIVNDVKACESIMEIGWKNRSVGATLMNADSSRSHSIFTIYVERMRIDDIESNNVKFGKLNLVDLAGSERQSKTGASGDRLKEATKINLSLSALGNVISALAKLREYQEEILWLKNLLKQHEAAQGSVQNQSTNNSNRIEEIKQAYDIKMKDLLSKYEEEVKSKQKLEKDIDQLKSIYEKNGNENIEDEESDGNNERRKSLKKDYGSEQSVLRAMEKLKELENQMVGGEKANDVELKEKRARKKRIAEMKLNAISEALSQLNDDDKILLKAYGDITEELRVKTMLIKKAKHKIHSLEQEVDDLQSEFESERTDYLETIRRLEEQIKLLMQIVEKMQPLLKQDCNYSNLNRIKEDAVWDENNQQWILPNVTFNRIRFPPAAAVNESKLTSSSTSSPREMTPSRLYRPDSPNVNFDSSIIDSGSESDQIHENGFVGDDTSTNNNNYNVDGQDKLLWRMENSQNNEINGLLNNKNTEHHLHQQQQIINNGIGFDNKFNYLTSIHNNRNNGEYRLQPRLTMSNGIVRNHCQPNHSINGFITGGGGSFIQSAEIPRKLVPLKRI